MIRKPIIPKVIAFAVLASGMAVSAGEAGHITLEQALDLALRNNPGLRAAAHTVEAEAALSRQAGRLPNPELEAGVEEYDRDGAGADSAETSLTLGMTIELGGKRRLRRNAAESRAAAAGSDYYNRKLTVIADTTRAFMEVVAAREHLTLAQAMTKLAREVHTAVDEKVKAGKEPSFRAAKAEGELELVRIAASESEASFRLAKQRLAAMWGARRAAFEGVDAELTINLTDLPSEEALQQHLSSNPALESMDAEVDMQHALLKVEKRAILPDLETSVGISQYEEDDTSAMAFGIGIPLPLFDWNRGNVRAAEQAVRKAASEREETEVALAGDLAESLAALESAYRRVRVLESKVVPAMESSFQSTHAGYKEGKFRLLEVLDSQQGLYDAKGALVDALLKAHSARADIERLIGMSLNEIDKSETE